MVLVHGREVRARGRGGQRGRLAAPGDHVHVLVATHLRGITHMLCRTIIQTEAFNMKGCDFENLREKPPRYMLQGEPAGKNPLLYARGLEFFNMKTDVILRTRGE